MGNTSLSVKNLTKNYEDFVLDTISFDIPEGSIVGLVGQNGTGKSTTIKAILELIQKDNGTVRFFDKVDQELNNAIRDQLGVVFDGSNFPESLTPQQLDGIFRNIYDKWESQLYFENLKKLELPQNKKIKEFSKGMKMKLSIAVAFSHHSKLLILDEATSGLDPIIRDEVLDEFLEFVNRSGGSILVSSHITSDLEKVADYIVFIHQGKVVFRKSKQELHNDYGLITFNEVDFQEIDKADILFSRKKEDRWQVLISDRETIQRNYPELIIEHPTIDEIMFFYIKGEKP